MKFYKCHVSILVRWGLRKRLASPSTSKFICGSLQEELQRIVFYDNSEFSSNRELQSFVVLGYDRLVCHLLGP